MKIKIKLEENYPNGIRVKIKCPKRGKQDFDIMRYCLDKTLVRGKDGSANSTHIENACPCFVKLGDNYVECDYKEIRNGCRKSWQDGDGQD